MTLNGSFSQLPTELISKIFSYLDFSDHAIVSKVCSLFNEIDKSDLFWKQPLEEFGIETEPLQDKAMVVSCYKRYCNLFLDKDNKLNLTQSKKENIFSLYLSVRQSLNIDKVQTVFRPYLQMIGQDIFLEDGRSTYQAGPIPDPKVLFTEELEFNFKTCLKAGASLVKSSIIDDVLELECSTDLIKFLMRTNKLQITSSDIIRRMYNHASDELLVFLLENMSVIEPKNPLGYISSHNGKPEQAVRKMTEKFPVTFDHIHRALTKEYSEDLVLFMLTKISKENLDNCNSCIYWSFAGQYSEEFIVEILQYASNLEDRYLSDSIKAEHSLKTIQAFVKKTKEIRYQIAESIFQNNYSFNECSELDAFFREIIKKCPNLKDFRASYAIGIVSDEILSLLIDREIKVQTFDLQKAMEHGYSGEVILQLLALYKKGFGGKVLALGSEFAHLAISKNYSREVVEALKSKQLPSKCIVM